MVLVLLFSSMLRVEVNEWDREAVLSGDDDSTRGAGERMAEGGAVLLDASSVA
jgi:hypothetical protein